MKKIIFLIVLFSFYNTQAQNLILNPSAELPMINGKIPNWTESIGNTWIRYDNLIDFGFAPNSTPNGNFWFYAQSSVQVINGLDISELEQTINISSDAVAIDSGTKKYFFNGFVRSFEQGINDQANVFIRFFDANNSLLNTYDYGPISDSSIWTNVNGTLLAPINSRSIKIKLHSVRRNGNSNDAVYDDLYLGNVPLLSTIQNTLSKTNVTISPNPSNGIFIIKINNPVEKASLIVSDLNGRIVHQLSADVQENQSLDLSFLQRGMYILTISNESYSYSQKIIKQ